MAEEKKDAQAHKDAQAQEEGGQEHRKSGNKSLLIVIAMLLLAVCGGIAVYLTVFNNGQDAQTKKKKEIKSALMALDPFVLNLAEPGRFLKVTMQIEIVDAALQPSVESRIPQLRDAVITLVSSKSADSVSTPDGKFQLKDDLLLRANQAMGEGVTFKNLYFTEFVMQ